jgi:hypothetical protein
VTTVFSTHPITFPTAVLCIPTADCACRVTVGMLENPITVGVETKDRRTCKGERIGAFIAAWPSEHLPNDIKWPSSMQASLIEWLHCCFEGQMHSFGKRCNVERDSWK